MQTELKIVHSEKTKDDSGILQLSPIKVNEEYLREWNERGNDFVCLTKNGELLRPTLYRVGGMNNPKLGIDRFFMLLKYSEAYYSKEILDMSKRNNRSAKHLQGNWCILDINGNEIIEFEKSIDYPYLIKDSCLYKMGDKCYNIITGEDYGETLVSFESREFIFLDNRYGRDESKRGVVKVNKKDGTWELFPE